MAKRPSLADSMNAVARAPAIPVREPEPAPAAPVARAKPEEGRGYFAATREGKKRVTFQTSPGDHRRLKRLSADTGRSIEALMTEALADLFAKTSS